uniref:Inactive ubiquitin carboxyl-terminal hydrolase 54-like n=1 Tax=Saccoglossus kowalevskii TaxID=10224 RepID=A0ABM0M3F4_SACKO|nr:PREDICTED: inactive ubiquitin carboxyl-terminal hydrolase 54-like [Saccoglossus kowalevskii]
MATWYDSSSLQRQYYNPRNSMSITNTKGLLNAPGENNCFLNSAVQLLNFKLINWLASKNSMGKKSDFSKHTKEKFLDIEAVAFDVLVKLKACTQAKLIIKENITSEPSMFSKLLANAGGVGDLRNCPSNCGKTIQIKRSLVNCPEIVSIGLVWDSDQPSIDHIMDVIRSLGTTIRLPYVFQGVFDERAHRSTLYLVGIVTYYGKHYSTFFFHTKLRVWIYFDDATVREIGNSWEDVVEKCRRGHYQPLLLLYADPHGTPISTDTAPQYVFKLPGHTQNTWGTDGACRSRHPSIPINIDPVSQDHNRCNSNSSGSSRSLSNHSSDSTGTVIYRPRETIPEVSTDTQSMSSAASTTDDAQNRKVRRSRSRARGHEMKKENYDTVSVSSSTSSNSSDKKKTRSKSLDRFRIKRQTSNVSESSRGSSTKEDYTDLNTMERRKPFQGIPIPPDRSSSTNIAGPKSPKAFKSPKVKRRGSFKGGKDNVRADIIRIPVTNNGDNQPDSLVYNPYGNLAVKKNEQIKSVETLKTDHSHWDDLQQIYQTPHANAENTGVGFPMAAPRSPQLKDLQQIHEQWLNDNKEKYGDDQRYWPVHGAPFNQPNEEYTDQTHFSRPLQYSQYTQQYRQQPIQQHIYYYPPQQQQQQQARYNLPSQVVPDTLSAHYQKSDVTNPKQLKRMTPKLVKQRNTENKPSIEPKQSKRYRRKSLGGMDTRGMDELREAIQPPQRPRSALPFRENMIRPEDRGYASGDEVRGGIIKSGFVTLPRKPKRW